MKLVLLRCPECTRPLTPENDDVVVVCTHCYTPVAIGVDGPSRMRVRYALPAGANTAAKQWVPYWVFEGQVRIQRRETQGGRSGGQDSEKMWAVPRRLYAPAWDLSLATAQEVGSRLAQQQPEIQFINRPEEARLTAATVTPNDARKLLEFIVLAIEARRKDWLKDLDFSIDVGEPELWAMPKGTYD